MEALFAELGRHWCRTMHRKTRWPIHGQYECSVCLRRYAVPWSNSPGHSPSSGLRPVLLTAQAGTPGNGRFRIGRRSAAA